ncbi:MAG: hypothetical protein KAH17_02425 [Bacteroidales bacterium]|nr:hypothetical protein [Bacteroidales bacterium]
MFYTLLKIQRFFEGLYFTGISILRILLRFKYRNSLRPFYQNNKELVILGNGPSLKESLVNQKKLLEDKELMAVNLFVLSDEFVHLRPQNYVLLDIGFFKSNTIPRVREVTERIIEGFLSKTDWEMNIFLPKEGRGSKLHLKLENSDKKFNFVFFNRTNVEGLEGFRHWAYRVNLGMPKPQNVLVGCLMLGICMKYSQVYILGADHSWLENIRISDNNTLISVEKHFYDKDTKGKPTKKEHPDTLESAKLHDYLYDLARTFSSYHLIREFADSQGVKVWNASEVSYIDAFDRVR